MTKEVFRASPRMNTRQIAQGAAEGAAMTSIAVASLPNDLSVAFRENEPGDVAFILKTWRMRLANCYTYNWAGFGNAIETLRPVCEKLLRRHGAIVACSPARPSMIIGFAVKDAAKNTAHFVYVHELYRRQGIAKTLLAGLELPLAVSFWVPELTDIGRKYHLNFQSVLRGQKKRDP